MAVLKAKQRNAMPLSEFGIPSEKKYPMPDKSHARNALARASQMVKAGKLAPGTAAKIRSKANKLLSR